LHFNFSFSFIFILSPLVLTFWPQHVFSSDFFNCVCVCVQWPCLQKLFPHFSSPNNTLAFVGPCLHRDRDYHIGSNFWKLYLIRIGFALGELVSLVKVFRLEWVFFGVQSVDTVGRCTTSYLLAGPACLWCLVLFSPKHSCLCVKPLEQAENFMGF